MEFERLRTSIIKVVGVGGGGCNAVNHMFKEGIQGVEFVVCNTDVQSLEASPVMNKIQLGKNLTDGLGAGNDPVAGKNAANESIEEIREMLQGGTKMVFITAGMGGGTGTGAAPVIASVARELGILTVGIVTEPFSFEGLKRKKQAEEGIAEIRKHVDSLIIICNDKLRELYGNLKLTEAFAKADNVLTTAAKGIAEIITVSGYVNVDFEDVKTVMKDSGVAIMGIGVAEGENRALKAAEMALSSPLLNDNNIQGAKNILVNITSGTDEIDLDELVTITDYIQEEAGMTSNIIWGTSKDETLGNKISVNLVAAGFDSSKDKLIGSKIQSNVKNVTVLEYTQKETNETKTEPNDPMLDFVVKTEEPEKTNTVHVDTTPIKDPKVYNLFDDQLPDENLQKNENTQNNVTEFPQSLASESSKSASNLEIKKSTPSQSENILNSNPTLTPQTQKDRISRLKDLSIKIRTCEGLEQLENEPAYKRRGVELEPTPPANQTDISQTSITTTPSGIQINKGNSFLHDNID